MPITRMYQTIILMYMPCGTKREKKSEREGKRERDREIMHQTLNLACHIKQNFKVLFLKMRKRE